MKEETVIKLTKNQLQNAINDHILQEKGLNEIFGMVVNSLMYAERQTFLEDSENKENKGNGYRTAQRAGIGSKLELKIPRDRLGVFKPVILGLLNQQEEKIEELCFELYGKGLTTRQIEGVIEKIYGSNYSKSSISRITTDFHSLIESWLNRDLDDYYSVIYIDAIHQKIRRDTVATEAFYVLLGVKEDNTREVLGVVNLPQESAIGWLEVLYGIQKRGVRQVGLFVFDGLKGLGDSIGKVYSSSLQQKCIIHYGRNLYKELRKNDRDLFAKEFKDIFRPDDPNYTIEQAMNNLENLGKKWGKNYKKIETMTCKANTINLFTYLNFDYRIRRMIYSTNWIERLNKSFRRTLNMRNALPSPESAITLIGYVAMEMTEGKYKFPINNFKFDNNFTYNCNE